MPDTKNDLKEKILDRIVHWGRWNLYFAQLLAGIAAFGSFGSAIAAASGKVSPSITTALAATPGCVIVISRLGRPAS
jgi:hypothetical protein